MRVAFATLIGIAIGVTLAGCVQTHRTAPDPGSWRPAAEAPPNVYRHQLAREARRGLRYDGATLAPSSAAGDLLADYPGLTADRAASRARKDIHDNDVLGALRWSTLAVLLDPDGGEPSVLLGDVLLLKQDWRRAQVAYRTAMQQSPESHDARYGLARALCYAGEWGTALVALEPLLRDQEPAVDVLHLATRAAYFDGQVRLAQRLAEVARRTGRPIPAPLDVLLDGRTPRAVRGRAAMPLHVGSAVRVDTTNPNAGNETSVIAADGPNCTVVAAWNDYRQGSARLGVGVSTDSGATWQESLVRPPVPNQAATEGDPMTAYDPRTDTFWVGAIAFSPDGGVFVARKDAGESSFEPAVMTRVTGTADKGWMAAGPDPLDPNQTRLYVTYNEGLLISTTMGDTWEPRVSLELGHGFLPRCGPAGELYVVYWDLSNHVMLRRSFDGGRTLLSPVLVATRMDVWGNDGTRFPGLFRVPPFAHLAVDPETGALYCVYCDTTEVIGDNSNVDVYFTKSTDQGAAWSAPVIVNSDTVPHGDQFFPWIEVDATGRVHLVYFDTRSVPQDDTATEALIQVYYSFSDDGGTSWSDVLLTPTAFSSDDDGFGGVFLGDYVGIAVTDDCAFPCYPSTDGGTANIYTHALRFPEAGDLNCDGAIDFGDINPFVLALVDPLTYNATYPDCDVSLGDLNDDGQTGFGDINPFVLLITGGP